MFSQLKLSLLPFRPTFNFLSRLHTQIPRSSQHSTNLIHLSSRQYSNQNALQQEQEELAKFQKLSAKWWNIPGEFRALHDMNHLRVSLIRDVLKPVASPLSIHEALSPPLPLSGVRILDVGCGGGILCEPLARLGAEVVGVDKVLDNIVAAQHHLQQTADLFPFRTEYKDRVKYRHCGAEDLLTTDRSSFDAVVASELLEHVPNWRALVADMTKLLRPGGSLFVTTINKTHLAWALGIVIAERVLRIVPNGTHDWEKFIPANDLFNVMEENGLSPCLLQGMMYNWLSGQWSWTKDVRLNYCIHATKLTENAEQKPPQAECFSVNTCSQFYNKI